tara:strand:- start:239 stop:1000 length:762 start_codon:yes stop_codon:yes gene_type:complete
MLKIVISSYNHDNYLQKCFNSILEQKFKHYELFIVDDMSTDNSIDIIKEYCNKYNWRYISNISRMGALYNRVLAINNLNCNDEDIIVIIDGDDWLSNETVFNYINNLYIDNDILLTFGGLKPYYNTKIYPKTTRTDPNIMNNQIKNFLNNKNKIIKNKLFRKKPYIFTQLQTFKFKLFKKIKKENYLDQNNNWYKTSTDYAYMYPLLELSEGKFKLIDKFVYIYNVHSSNVHSVKKKEMSLSEMELRNKKIIL